MVDRGRGLRRGIGVGANCGRGDDVRVVLGTRLDELWVLDSSRIVGSGSRNDR